MKQQMTIIHESGGTTEMPLDHVPGFKELQAAVGGMIEVVPYFDRWQGHPCIAFCNEDGKVNGLPVNQDATRYWYALVGHLGDYLCGDVVIVTGPPEFLEEL